MKYLKNREKKSMMVTICILAVCFLLVIALFPPSMGKLPKRSGSRSLSERTCVETEDGALEIMLLSEDTENPVLLVCGGGPGIPQYLLESSYPSALPEEFTVCYWDYRDTGASYSAATVPDEMTTGRYIQDALHVTDFLRERFCCDRICIMGHSFGTYLALKTVQAHPEKYLCYIAMSQIVDQKESEYIAFDWMKNQYEQSGNTKMAKRFEQYDIRGSAKDYDDYFFSGLRDEAMHDLTARDMHSVISGIFFPSLRCRAYTQAERIRIWKGKAASRAFPVTQDAIVFNAVKDVPSVEIPVFFLVGEYDYTCCSALQKEYYSLLDAPEKKIYVFENAAHSPIYEEYDRGKQILIEIKQEV